METKNTATLHGRQFRLLIPTPQVQEAIRQVAREVNADYRNGTFRRPLVLVTLSGALVFGGELFRQLEGDFELGFVRAFSYGSGMESAEDVRIELSGAVDVAGRDVLVVEDVVDSGRTAESLRTLLCKAQARRVWIATLLFKPEAYRGALLIDYVGLRIEDRFVVGYGLDYDQAGRNLNAIYVLDQ